MSPRHRSGKSHYSPAEADLLELLAHELRSPLGTVQLWTHLLKTSGSDPAAAERALGMIERGVRSLEQVVADVLDLSRIAAGRLNLEAGPMDLAALVTDAVDQAKEAAAEKGVQLGHAAAASPLVILGDAPRLLRALGKLLANALKLTPRGGTVEVRLEQEGPEARIVISDTGMDAGPASPPGGPASPRSQRTLELGLSVVRTVVGLHGGRVQARVWGPEGGSVAVALPLAEHPPPDGSAPTPERGRLAGTRVLLVDDCDDAREAMKIMLEHWGASVATAGSANEALERLKTFRPHVLVSDLAMPGEDGYSLIHRVRALEAREGGETPAVALTAFTTANDRRRALEAGYQRHVSKPLDPADLFAVVAALARSHTL